jgi:hypothetical protein
MRQFMVMHSYRGEVGQAAKNFWRDGGDERDRSRHVVAGPRGEMEFRDSNDLNRMLYVGVCPTYTYPQPSVSMSDFADRNLSR